MKRAKAYNLPDRLISYAARIIKLAEALPATDAGKHIAKQSSRRGTSPAANYGEAQSAESRLDFIHKVKIALKELRETNVWLRIIVETKMINVIDKLNSLVKETDELIAIFCASGQTVRDNLNAK